ncbi:DUF4822 domain-containing protein [Apibacter sp. HY039]|uniref:DUF4822 domain-containing protein n=1 Tax=Apibacter sp. HY039 TaxID=2501476 RepID=UPI000FEBF5C7|nr:DUF4822 domain-containing protein [Apibacter sp. HY039]
MTTKRLISVIFMSITTLILNVSCSDDDLVTNLSPQGETKSDILSTHVWITTKVTDNRGNQLDLSVAPASNYAGYAYYRTDGTFRIVDFTDQPKIFGEWSLINDESQRKLVVYNSDNSVAFERNVDIMALSHTIFTYAIPDSSDPSIIYYVEHIPVNHNEVLTPAQVLASTDWTTTKVWDITNGQENAVEMDRTVAPASNFSGDAYYINNSGNLYFPKNDRGEFSNGNFMITAYGDKSNVRSQGEWYVSLDGKLRNLIAKNNNGEVLWSRTVAITELTSTKFTYDIQVDSRLLRVEHEPLGQ